MPRKPRKLPDYFTMEEANELVQATESGDTRLAMRLMLRCGLRVSEALQVRPSQLRFDRSPPIISLPADIVGNKAKTAREIPIPDDLVEVLRDRASGETKARNRPLVVLSRQAVGQGMKKAAAEVGVDPAHGSIPMPSGTPTGATASSRAYRSMFFRSGWATRRWI